MKYIRVRWMHSFSTEPALIYIELGDGRWEHRKVEIFPDGRCGYASRLSSKGNTGLSKEPLPSLDEITLDPQFELVEISKETFQEIWVKAQAQT